MVCVRYGVEEAGEEVAWRKRGEAAQGRVLLSRLFFLPTARGLLSPQVVVGFGAEETKVSGALCLR